MRLFLQAWLIDEQLKQVLFSKMCIFDGLAAMNPILDHKAKGLIPLVVVNSHEHIYLCFIVMSFTPLPCPMFSPSFVRFSMWRHYVALVFLD